MRDRQSEHALPVSQYLIGTAFVVVDSGLATEDNTFKQWYVRRVLLIHCKPPSETPPT
jgi:hypothetical protein